MDQGSVRIGVELPIRYIVNEKKKAEQHNIMLPFVFCF